MRLQGKVADWKDDRGFGFIVPRGGGPKVFVHARAAVYSNKRLGKGDEVTYEVGTDNRRRRHATRVLFLDEKLPEPREKEAHSWLRWFALLYLVAITILSFAQVLPLAVPIIYLVLSLVSFLAYADDKAKASARDWRTPESTLLAIDVLGGWPGAVFAQILFRHKTSKTVYQEAFGSIIFLHILLLVGLRIGIPLLSQG